MTTPDSDVQPDPGDDDPFSPTWRYGELFDTLAEKAWKRHQGDTERYMAPYVLVEDGRVIVNNGTGGEAVDLTPEEAVALGVSLIQSAVQAQAAGAGLDHDR